MPPIRVLIADADPAFHSQMRQVCQEDDDLVVVGETADGQETVQAVCALHPDILLMDVDLPAIDAIQVTRLVSTLATRVILLTAQPKKEGVLQAIQAGASGYLKKGIDGPKLAHIICVVYQGGAFIDSLVTANVLEEFRHHLLEQHNNQLEQW